VITLVKAPEERLAREVGAVLCLLLASVFVGLAVWLTWINIPAIALFVALAVVAVVQADRLLRERP
jgi:uncharacterized membrane protein